MTTRLVLLGLCLAGMSGIPGLFMSRRNNVGQGVTTALAVLGASLGLLGLGVYWATPLVSGIRWPWLIPGADFDIAVDGLSALFLFPIFLISLLGNIYGLGYWRQTEHQQNGRKLRLFYGLLTASMALVVIARNSIVFLFGWEIMALSAFFLVTAEDHVAEVRETGWIYLVAMHVATLCLFALFGILRAVGGSFDLIPLAANALTPGLMRAIFVLSLIGFGIKAGIMPLHVWLPSAHAIAPSHVSAIMSGVIIKMGIYGLVRIYSLVPHPPVEWGSILLGLGAISGILGVAFAIGQHDLKRLLAYHSIENIGIIVIGLGLALLGRSLGHADWVILGLSGALLHVWNHALFKTLLFLSAGSVIRAVYTREIDHLGGLSKAMPRTALCFLIGAVAICGLPPLNGFISEFLIYLGLFKTLSISGSLLIGVMFAVPALALIGTLAVACFVKVYGAVFLGKSRSEHAEHAQESPLSMVGSMGMLVGCCFFIGLVPFLMAPILGQAVTAWVPELRDAESRLKSLAPLGWISAMGVTLLAVLILIYAWQKLTIRRRVMQSASTWGCAYVAQKPSMQYSSSSFAQMLVGLFAWALRPRVQTPKSLPLFPQPAIFHSDVPDTVLNEAVLPAFHIGAWIISWFRVFQQGSTQTYLLYILLILIILLLWR